MLKRLSQTIVASLLCIVGLDASFLSPEQIDRYNQDGFLIIENFVPESECDTLRQRALQLVQSFDPQTVRSIFSTENQQTTTDEYFMTSADKIRFFFEKDAFLPDGSLRQSKELSINKIGHALHDLDPVFDRFTRNPRLAAITHDLGVHNPLLLQSMYIFKQPFIGGEVTCHQDGSFLYTEPDTVLGFWFALEDATVQNGCLWAIPGGHSIPLKLRFVADGQGSVQFIHYDTTPWDLTAMVPLEVKKGDLIILHSRVPHMSYANTSEKSRHACTLHVFDASSNYPSDNWLQRSEALPLRGFKRVFN